MDKNEILRLQKYMSEDLEFNDSYILMERTPIFTSITIPISLCE